MLLPQYLMAKVLPARRQSRLSQTPISKAYKNFTGPKPVAFFTGTYDPVVIIKIK